jgi:alpha-tubulin suppressor-like RCC1 family protein
MTLLGNAHVREELQPKLVEALRGVRVGCVAASHVRSCAVADTGGVWAWGLNNVVDPPVEQDEANICREPKPMQPLRGVKVDALSVDDNHVLALADDGVVYACGSKSAANSGALGLGPAVSDEGEGALVSQRILGLRVACGL